MGSINEIGSFEAKTRLSELLRETEAGREFLILRRGKPVARLVPVESVGTSVKEIFSDLERVRQSARRASLEELEAWKTEGRR